jgi:hypothetical protein
MIADFGEQFFQFFRVYGFHKMIVKTGIPGALAVFGLAVARHGDQHRLFGLLTNAPRQLIAVYAGQPDIKHCNVEVSGERGLQSGGTILRGLDFVTAQPQQHCQAFNRIRIVVHHQQSQRTA